MKLEHMDAGWRTYWLFTIGGIAVEFNEPPSDRDLIFALVQVVESQQQRITELECKNHD